MKFDNSSSGTKIRLCHACYDARPRFPSRIEGFIPPNCWECCWPTAVSWRDLPWLRSHPLNAQCGSIKARPPDAMQDSEGSSGCPTGSMEALLQLPDSPASSSARNLHPVLPSPHLPRYGSREPSPINALHANLRVCFSSNPTCNRQSDNQTIKIHFLHGC